MPEVGRKENLGLETVGERLTTAWNYLVGCKLYASRTGLREMEVGECGSVLCRGQVNGDVSLKFPSRLPVALCL